MPADASGGPTPFAALAELAERLEGLRGRNAMADQVGAFLRGLAPEEVAPAARMLIGRVLPAHDARTLDVSWAAVWRAVRQLVDLPPEVVEDILGQNVDGGSAVAALLRAAAQVWTSARPAAAGEQATRLPEPSPPPPAGAQTRSGTNRGDATTTGREHGAPLGLIEVYHALEAIAAEAGPGSRERKDAWLLALLRRASPVEAKHLAKVVMGEMRHGVSEGVLLDALARTTGIARAKVGRADQLAGDVGELARTLLLEGEAGLTCLGISLYRPLKPMLAETADDVAEAWAELGGQLALEYKLDGARIQVHIGPAGVRIYSRHLSDVTASLPDVVAAVERAAPAAPAIFEGEVMALDAAGRPLPFQTLMRRFLRVQDVEAVAAEVPAMLFLFDLLLAPAGAGGSAEATLDLPYAERWARLEAAAGGLQLVPRLIPASVEAAEAFYARALADGHEGLVAKRLDSPYTPGKRGAAWLKLKRAVTLDLVIVAADWGYGRRHGWLSNYHLAVREPETGRYLEVGKTFKGLTDAEFAEMTERLLALKRAQRGGTVFVEPRLVVEVAFNEILESPRYSSKLALRHARITRFRFDKPPESADTIDTLHALHAARWAAPGGDAPYPPILGGPAGMGAAFPAVPQASSEKV